MATDITSSYYGPISSIPSASLEHDTSKAASLYHSRLTKTPLSALLPTEREQYISDEFTEEQIEKKEQMKREEIDGRINILNPTKVLNIMLLGESGSGKSSTGNLILGEEKFKVSSGATACTKGNEAWECLVDGVRFRVTDTPGYEQRHDYPATIQKFGSTFDGDHIYVLVQSLSQRRTSEEAKEQFRMIKERLSYNDIKLHQCILLYTHGRSLFDMGNLKEQTLDGYLKFMLSIDDIQGRTNRTYTEMYEDFRNRVIAIENLGMSAYEENLMRNRLLSFLRCASSRRKNMSGEARFRSCPIL